MNKLDFGGVQTYTQDSGESDFGCSNTCGKVSPMGTPGTETYISTAYQARAKNAAGKRLMKANTRKKVLAYMDLCAKHSDEELKKIMADRMAAREKKIAARNLQARREKEKKAKTDAAKQKKKAAELKKIKAAQSAISKRGGLSGQGFDYETSDDPIAIGSVDFGSQGFDFEVEDSPVSIGYTQDDLELQSEPISIGAVNMAKLQKNMANKKAADAKKAAMKNRTPAEKQKAFQAKYAADCQAARAIVKLPNGDLLAIARDTTKTPSQREFARAVYDRRMKQFANSTSVLTVKDFGVNGQMSSMGAVDFGDALSPDGAGFNNPVRKTFDEFGGVVASPDAGFHDTINGMRAGIDDQFGGVQSFLKTVEKIAKTSLKKGVKTATGSALQKGSQALANDPKAKQFVEEQAKAAFEKGKTSFFKDYGGKIALGSVLVAGLGIYLARRK